MKTIEIVNAQPILEKMTNFDLPLPSAVKLSKIVTQLNEVFKIYFEKRTALFSKYGEPDKENTANITVPEENREEFQAQLHELLSSEIELEIKKLNVADLGNDIKLSANEVGTVSWIFNTDEQ